MESFIDRITNAKHFVLTIDFGLSCISIPLDFDGIGPDVNDGTLNISAVGGTDGCFTIHVDEVTYDEVEDEYSVIEAERGATIVFSNIQ